MGDDEITMTHDDLRALTRPAVTIEMLSAALAKDRERARDEEASRSAQERMVMGAFGSWFRHRWKIVIGVVAGLSTLGALGTKGWAYLQERAEEAVLERHVDEQQAEAVEANTKEVASFKKQANVRLGAVETDVEINSQITRFLLELQLRDPKTKRLLKNDDELRGKANAIPGINVKKQ